ncbi:alpha/beta fold hydrolase [Nocardioides pocheonensis]|jgi:dienelactone hydrolase|uniref:Alpha/beta fold hydrolase n=1 Tax=Nocardioides pocheonensis TaxID=661485 RepID=A0A3N0GIB6_9ACTN|nr:alpha/beta fold hydrolase [Nocardioides pocheonensis]RNM11912.1 alpha/beta fold hydrolase [Nocardioides pocheonensis]
MAPREPTRRDVAFSSDGEECKAWLFLTNTERPPLVVMGHGLGGTREMGLEPYARAFALAGMAVLVFTYRHFGDSEGMPRRLIDVDHQLGDWIAALAYARTIEEIDPTRIAVWGTSFGGGHVIEVAAHDGGVAAVISQCPFTDGLASLRVASPQSLLRQSEVRQRMVNATIQLLAEEGPQALQVRRVAATVGVS